jgi:hypothetical protein
MKCARIVDSRSADESERLFIMVWEIGRYVSIVLPRIIGSLADTSVDGLDCFLEKIPLL